MLEDENYYLFNCDTEILQNYSKEIIQTFKSPKINLIDLGAGDGKKSKILIDGALSLGISVRYIGVDIADASNDVLEDEMRCYTKKENLNKEEMIKTL